MGNKSCAILYNLFKIGFNRQILYSYSRPYNFPNNAKLVDGVWVEKTKEEIVDEFNLNNIVSNDYQPIIYGIEMNRFIGTWLDVYEGYSKEQQRAGTLATIKYYYNKYKLIPNFTWHIENPYVPTAWEDPKYGRGLASRYRYSSEGYPQEHRYVINEILNNTGGVCGTGTFSGKKVKNLLIPKHGLMLLWEKLNNLYLNLKMKTENKYLVFLDHYMKCQMIGNFGERVQSALKILKICLN